MRLLATPGANNPNIALPKVATQAAFNFRNFEAALRSATATGAKGGPGKAPMPQSALSQPVAGGVQRPAYRGRVSPPMQAIMAHMQQPGAAGSGLPADRAEAAAREKVRQTKRRFQWVKAESARLLKQRGQRQNAQMQQSLASLDPLQAPAPAPAAAAQGSSRRPERVIKPVNRLSAASFGSWDTSKKGSNDKAEKDPFGGPGKTVRDGLYVYDSGIAGAGKGLYSRKDLPAGAWLGFYSGEHYTETQFDALPDVAARRRYVAGGRFKYDDYFYEIMISPQPDPENPNGAPDLFQHPLAAINEPPTNVSATVFALSEKVQTDARPSSTPSGWQSGPNWGAVSLYTGVAVPAHTELFWNYGKKYSDARDYEPGPESRKLNTAEGRESEVGHVIEVLEDGYRFSQALVDLEAWVKEPTRNRANQ